MPVAAIPAGYLVAASLATTAIGTGIGVYSSMQAANNEKRIAAYNAELANRQAELQGQVAQRQAEVAAYNSQLSQRQADLNKQMAEYQATVAERNATTLRAYADQGEARGREEARRMREEKARILAGMRSGYAKSGVTTEGSPLAVLAEADGTLELQIQDMWWQSTNEAKKLRGEAEGLDFEAAVTRRGGEYSHLLASRAADQSLTDAMFEREAAGAGVRIAKRQAEIDRLAGNNRASAYQLQGLASGISGVGDVSRTLLNYGYNSKPRAS